MAKFATRIALEASEEFAADHIMVYAWLWARLVDGPDVWRSEVVVELGGNEPRIFRSQSNGSPRLAVRGAIDSFNRAFEDKVQPVTVPETLQRRDAEKQVIALNLDD